MSFSTWMIKTGIGLSFMATTVFTVGLSDREGAEEALERNGYTVLRYDGKTMLHRGYGEFYGDKFRVQDSTGRKQEMAVVKNLSGEYRFKNARTLEKDRAQPLKRPYNPFGDYGPR